MPGRTFRPEQPPNAPPGRNLATLERYESGTQQPPDVEAAIHAREEAAREQVHEQMAEADLAQLARDAGMDPDAVREELRANPQAARSLLGLVARNARKRRENFEANTALERERGEGGVTLRMDQLEQVAGQMSDAEFVSWMRQQQSVDRRKHNVLMWRPPAADGYGDRFPEEIPKVVADRWHDEFGFRVTPTWPLRPPPAVLCGMRTTAGVCGTRLYTAAERIEHQRIKHRSAFRAEREAQEQERWELDREERRRQHEAQMAILRGLSGAPSAPAPPPNEAPAQESA
jgi:hypothetical protein